MNLISWGLIGLTSFFAFINICYYLFIYAKFAFHKRGNYGVNNNEPVSVIISAKNEIKNLSQFLPSILKQNYPNFEVIVVNDGSWDDTSEYIEELMKSEPLLRLVDVKVDEKYQRGKKLALTLGIKAATHEWLLFTDADCQPLSENWIMEMSRGMADDKEIVLGYSKYQRRNSFLNLFIRWETFFTAMQYFSYSIIGRTYMGVGRNLAYRKSLFFKVKGFASHQHIMTGDDDLFVNETANKTNVAIIYSRDSFVQSQPKLTWGTWWQQKKRHFYSGKYYKKEDKRILGLFTVSQIFYYLSLTAALIFASKYWYIIIAIYAVRFIIQNIILFKSMKKLRITKIIGFAWLLDFLMIPYYLTVGITGLLTKKIKW
jgi:cellulose synthase/poly-beta-1,6-N-acetylglucosamine synthase-like glycosyltransferase